MLLLVVKNLTVAFWRCFPSHGRCFYNLCTCRGWFVWMWTNSGLWPSDTESSPTDTNHNCSLRRALMQRSRCLTLFAQGSLNFGGNGIQRVNQTILAENLKGFNIRCKAQLYPLPQFMRYSCLTLTKPVSRCLPSELKGGKYLLIMRNQTRCEAVLTRGPWLSLSSQNTMGSSNLSMWCEKVMDKPLKDRQNFLVIEKSDSEMINSPFLLTVFPSQLDIR